MLAVRIPDLPTWAWVALIPVAIVGGVLYIIWEKRNIVRTQRALERDLARRGFELVSFRVVPQRPGPQKAPVLMTKYRQDRLEYLVVFRDAVIVGGALLFQTLTQSLTMEPLMISKVNTAAQIVFAALVLGTNGFALGDWVIVDVMAYVVAITTVSSGAVYVVEWSRRASAAEEKD